MKMIGGPLPSASSRCSSRPLEPGSCRSSTRQAGESGFSASRNSAAEPYAATPKPNRCDQAGQCLAHAIVVIHNEDNGIVGSHDTGLNCSGSVKQNVAPGPSPEAAQRRPL